MGAKLGLICIAKIGYYHELSSPLSGDVRDNIGYGASFSRQNALSKGRRKGIGQ